MFEKATWSRHTMHTKKQERTEINFNKFSLSLSLSPVSSFLFLPYSPFSPFRAQVLRSKKGLDHTKTEITCLKYQRNRLGIRYVENRCFDVETIGLELLCIDNQLCSRFFDC